ncbi:hypothetical protein PR048_004132 [Dryococelus australis]|uniref:Uncharacterized protein n=1 Tax=Dryococelus australis TaxID=614101 RepID=A0ABQ9I4M1_9NEOP|nr:hypothetical protein PR048_004132 [Dryococelus australis]
MASAGISHLGNKTAAYREKEFRKVLHRDSVKACVSANLPLTKLNNLEFRAFLNKHIVNGGSIPNHS